MKKNLLIAAIAITALAGCTEETFVGEKSLQEANGGGAISFNLNVPAVTRANKTGKDAADDLSSQFIIYGEKDETTDGNAPVAGKLVFQNYKVGYTTSSAYTTTSNTKDWEYVGLSWTSDEHSHITTTTTDVQTIKYWDYGAASYTFTAVSADPTDISSGRVSITKTTAKTDGNKVYDKGYSIVLAKSGTEGSYVYPKLNKLYLSDRNVILKGEAPGADRTAVNAYGGNVTLTFRNLVSQVRVGIYETIPGYDIYDITFYISDGNDEGTDLDPTAAHAFGAICPNINVTNFEGTLNVTYYNSGATIDQPIVTAGGTPANDLVLGNNFNTLKKEDAPVLLGKSATAPTWDKVDGSGNSQFTEVLPQIGNTTNLKLKVDYKLWNNVSGEVITVTGATAEIPYQYLQWKPNFKYTYLFKISDESNGQTGTGTTPAGLYPITFDAVEVVAADGQAEYITTVSEPSITTFGVKNSEYTTGKNEYEAGSDIYVTVVDGNVVVCPTLGTNINVYKATTTNATLYPITEASVAESLAEISAGTKKITVVNKNEDASDLFASTAPAIATTVPQEDGTSITSIKCVLTSAPSDWVASSDNVYYSDAACNTKVTTAYSDGTYYKKSFALKLTGVKATSETTALVVEYVKTPATYNNNGGSVFTLADQAAFNTEVSTNGKIYTDTNCTEELTWSAYNGNAGSKTATYYRRISLKTIGTYAYKVIRVQ